MSSNFTVVVSGLPQMTAALAGSGQFTQVVPVATTGELKALLQSKTLSPGTADKVFFFSDSTPVNTPQSLEFLIQRMTGMGARVIIVATSPAGKDLVARCPGAGLLEGPLYLNTVLGALHSLGVPVAPAGEAANVAIPVVDEPAPAAGNSFGQPAPQPQTAVSNPFGAPAAEPAQAPVANPFMTAGPVDQPEPSAAPAFGAPEPAQAPAGNPFGTPAAEPVQAAAGNVFGQPAPQQEPGQAHPFGTPAAEPAQAAAGNPFGQPAPHQEPGQAHPFGTPAAEPVQATAGNPFGQPAPHQEPGQAHPFGGSQAPGNAFGQAAPQQEPAPANPFGGPQTGPSNPFGGHAPEPAQAPAGNPFGQAAPQQEPAPTNPFGGPQGPANPFGQAAAGPSNPFGSAAAAAQPAAGPSNPFGGAPADPTQATNPFGQPPAHQPAPPFGGGQPAAFGGQPTAAAAPAFGADPTMSPPAAATFGGPGRPVPRHDAAPVQPRQRRGYVITVTAPKGGTGKSTLSLNLAAYLGLRLQGTGRNVCIVDANVQQADTGKYLSSFTPNVEDVLKNVSAIHPDRINDYLLHKPELNMSALLGPMTPDAANPMFFSGKRYSQILDALRPNFDYIVIDTPVAELYHDLFREFALPQANFIVVAITPNYTTLMNTDAWLRQVTAPKNANGMGVDKNQIGIVLNRAEEGVGFTEDEVLRDLGEWRFLGSVPETKEWKRCNNLGELVATKNYHELNEAFSLVLVQATGEEILQTTPANLVTDDGLLGKLRGLFSKKG